MFHSQRELCFLQENGDKAQKNRLVENERWITIPNHHFKLWIRNLIRSTLITTITIKGDYNKLLPISILFLLHNRQFLLWKYYLGIINT